MRKYNEIMKHIELTGEMQERIIENISVKQKQKRMHIVLKTALAAAACVILAVGAFSLRNKMHINIQPEETSVSDTQQGYQCEEFSSISALSEAIGVEMEDIGALPFPVTETTYCLMFDSFADVNYYGANDENCCYRAGKTEEDISGDYNEYDTIKETEIHGKTVTLKANGDQYYLATWVKDNHFYSIWISCGTDEASMINMIPAN